MNEDQEILQALRDAGLPPDWANTARRMGASRFLALRAALDDDTGLLLPGNIAKVPPPKDH
jgi:hypothetical protein